MKKIKKQAKPNHTAPNFQAAALSFDERKRLKGGNDTEGTEVVIEDAINW